MRRERSRALALALAACAALAGCDAPTVPGEPPAYDPTVLTAGRVYHWPLGATVRVYVHGEQEAERAALRGAVVEGAAGWTATLRYRELAVTLAERAEEADVVVGFDGAGYPVALDACGGLAIAAARAVLCPHADSARTLPLRSGATGRVKVAIVVDAAAVSSAAQLRALVTHELGHALGVGGHSPDARDVMHATPVVRSPSARDAGTLRYVLHRPAAVRL